MELVMTPIRTRSAPLAAAAIFLTIAAAQPDAQNALGAGNVLDNSLQQGQRVNPRASSGAYSEALFRNAVVTGNVGAGLSFRGDLGYTAADDFRGELGSDDLFDEIRDSASSGAVATRGVSSLDALRQTLAFSQAYQTDGFGGSPIIVRSGVGQTTAQATYPALREQFSRDAFGRIRGSLRSTTQFTSRQALDVEPINLATNSQGQSFVISGSRLFGLRADQPGSPFLTRQPDYDFLNQTTPHNPLDPTNNQRPISETPETQDRPPNQLQSEQLDPGQLGSAQITGITSATASDGYSQVVDQLRASAAKLDQRFTTPDPTIQPDPEADNDPQNPDIRPDADVLQNPELAIVADPLMDQLDLIRQALAGPVNDPFELAPLEINAVNPLDRDDRQDAEENTDEQPLDRDGIRRAAQLLRDTEIQVTRLRAAHIPDDIYSEHVAAGEDALDQELYFTAEERFTAALSVKPGDPMASVGRIHAQLAGGLYRSAALNLTNLFLAYPELVPATYDDSLLPPDERVIELLNQLNNRSQPDSKNADQAALLLAYLAYQSNQPEMLNVGLSRMAQDDPLSKLLHLVWSDSAAPNER